MINDPHRLHRSDGPNADLSPMVLNNRHREHMSRLNSGDKKIIGQVSGSNADVGVVIMGDLQKDCGTNVVNSGGCGGDRWAYTRRTIRQRWSDMKTHR